MRLFKALAILHIVLGVLCLIGVGLAALSLLLPEGHDSAGVDGYLLAFSAFLSVLLVYPGIKHVKHPGRKTALSLSGSSVALIWIIFTGLAAVFGSTAPVYNFVPLGVGLLIHRFGLKPLAETTYPVGT